MFIWITRSLTISFWCSWLSLSSAAVKSTSTFRPLCLSLPLERILRRKSRFELFLTRTIWDILQWVLIRSNTFNRLRSLISYNINLYHLDKIDLSIEIRSNSSWRLSITYNLKLKIFDQTFLIVTFLLSNF